MTECKHRGFTITQYTHGNGSWIIYNSLGHQVGNGGFNTAWSAIVYIDELLSP